MVGLAVLGVAVPAHASDGFSDFRTLARGGVIHAGGEPAGKCRAESGLSLRVEEGYRAVHSQSFRVKRKRGGQWMTVVEAPRYRSPAVPEWDEAHLFHELVYRRRTGPYRLVAIHKVWDRDTGERVLRARRGERIRRDCTVPGRASEQASPEA